MIFANFTERGWVSGIRSGISYFTERPRGLLAFFGHDMSQLQLDVYGNPCRFSSTCPSA